MADTVKADKPKQPKDHRLEVDRFHLAEHARHDWIARAEQGVTLETIQDPAYWANYGHKMKPWDQITVRTDDGTLWAELLVLACGRAWAKVKVLRHVNLTNADVEQSQIAAPATQASFQYRWKGPNKKHCIIRSDGAIVHEGAQTKQDAIDWAKNNQIDLTAVTS